MEVNGQPQVLCAEDGCTLWALRPVASRFTDYRCMLKV
jgi:hypothetical protein